jgi:4-amino-4-deoxy-L-arabinose transferase-like glycosyltransferase
MRDNLTTVRTLSASTASRAVVFPVAWVIVLMAAASLAVRLAAWRYFGTGTIESEGAEYARIAQNLRDGLGYVGLVADGPQVIFHPFYPYLIAAVSFFVRDYELAGRVASIAICCLLPLPVAGIASLLFNRRVGLIAGALAVLHPLSMYLSFMVYSEGPYATLLLTAVYLVLLALDDEKGALWRWCLVGAAFGVAYLLRAEAAAALAISLVFALLATPGTGIARVKRIACAIAIFAVCALPEILFIQRSTGRALLEAKTPILFSYTGRRILAAEKRPGVPYVSDGGVREVPTSAANVDGGYPEKWEEKWAAYAVDGDARPTGFAMRPWVDMARETHVSPKDMIPLIAKGMRQNIPGFFENMSMRWLGAPLLPALALLGAVRRPWRRRKGLNRTYLLAVTAAPVAATLLVLWGDARYYFIFVPLLCIWAANGLFELGLWAKATGAALRLRWLNPTVPQYVVPAVVALTMVAFAVGPVRAQYEFTDSAKQNRIDKEVGLWILQREGHRTRVMDLSLPLSFHANADHVYFPYTTGGVALHFLDTGRVDYIVLRRSGKFTRYYADWLAHGIPDPRAERIAAPSEAANDKFVIYKWHPREQPRHE